MHVVPGALVAGRLRQLGYRHVRALHDNLAVGPVALDPALTCDLRRAYWLSRGIEAGVDDLHDLDDPATPKVLWSVPTWSARLSCWRVLHGCGPGGRGAGWRFASWQRPVVSEPEESAYEELGRDRVREQLRTAVAVGEDLRDAAACLWTAYASRTPEAVATLRWHDMPAYPSARAHFAAYADALPRRGRVPGVALVSRNDELLLAAVSSTTWQRPVDLLRVHARVPALLRVMTRYGDDFMIARWRSFAAAPCRALELRPVAGINAWTDCELRLSRTGAALLRDGTCDPAALPSLQVGGAVAYRHPLWVCGETSGGTWSLEPA